MFIVDPDAKTITIHRGDTGGVRFTATGVTFGADDRAVFTMKDPNGNMIKEEVCELEDGAFKVYFRNSDTDGLAPGTYSWDVRYVFSPEYDTEGRIVDGRHVYTPTDPNAVTIKSTVGDI